MYLSAGLLNCEDNFHTPPLSVFHNHRHHPHDETDLSYQHPDSALAGTLLCVSLERGIILSYIWDDQGENK